MVTTRTDDAVVPRDLRPSAPSRLVARAPGLPGARAVVGGALVAAAAVGTFASWRSATGAPNRSFAVAVRSLVPGERLDAGAVRFEAIDLPEGPAAAAFESMGELDGRVVVAPIGEGELLQRGSASDQVAGPPAAELSVALGRDLAVDGRLRPGDTVDVYATDEGTTLAAAGLRVVAVTEGAGSLTEGGDLTVTLAIPDPAQGAPIVDAARQGQVTLVRTTHAGPAPVPAGPAAGPVPVGPDTSGPDTSGGGGTGTDPGGGAGAAGGAAAGSGGGGDAGPGTGGEPAAEEGSSEGGGPGGGASGEGDGG
ncbi:MAG TPA: SAF domain-containing protein [Acidimicrobiales bacterium]|nr:SAF domain-containing protein [Acidimicrobiales bacterium]